MGERMWETQIKGQRHQEGKKERQIDVKSWKSLCAPVSFHVEFHAKL